MARIAGVNIPNHQHAEIALTAIYGIGRTRADEILAATGISPDLRVKDLTDEQLIPLREYIEANFKIEGDRYIPRRLVLDNSDTMFDKKSFIMEQECQQARSQERLIDENTRIYQTLLKT